MKQVIRYLYEYENGNRIRNVGFIKLEKRMDKCAIHIHGKNLDFGQKRNWRCLYSMCKEETVSESRKG